MENPATRYYHRTALFLLAVIGMLAIPAFQARAQTKMYDCSGILHKDRNGLRLSRVRGEGVCIINKSEESKVLAECAPGRHCKVMGVMENCEDRDQCAIATDVLAAVQAQAYQECSGVLHKDRNGLRFGGREGEGEGICLISKSQVRKVLGTCIPDHFCMVKGVMKICEDGGQCGEIIRVVSVRRK